MGLIQSRPEAEADSESGLGESSAAVDLDPRCRACGARLTRTFVDLGVSPLANSYVRAEEQKQVDLFYPLQVWVCDSCLLVQLEEFESPENIFSEYHYFSSFVRTLVDQAQSYVEEVQATLGLTADSRVIELGSNDGYLLQHFVEAGVQVLGIEPAANVARAAEARGIPTRIRFFSEALAAEMAEAGETADLVVANNVLAHVPKLNDFVVGIRRILRPNGVVSVEFPHLLRLIEGCQFDTIYHEHFSYFTLLVVRNVFRRHGLSVFDVQELPVHGGSLRVWAEPSNTSSPRLVSDRVDEILQHESESGLHRAEGYDGFEIRVQALKRRLVSFLIDRAEEGQTVVGYGAPAKANTLLNYCGIRPDLLAYTVDLNPHKQGMLLPGSRIPIYPPERLRETRPDFVLILPWNLAQEITEQQKGIREWGAHFVVPVPDVKILRPTRRRELSPDPRGRRRRRERRPGDQAIS